jgi:hypothetical protein
LLLDNTLIRSSRGLERKPSPLLTEDKTKVITKENTGASKSHKIRHNKGPAQIIKTACMSQRKLFTITQG